MRGRLWEGSAPPVRKMAEEKAWMDLAANSHIWGGIREQYTCHAPNAIKPSRRDYMIVSGGLVSRVGGCRVHYCDTFPTHWPVQMKLRMEKKHDTFEKLLKTDSADEALRRLIEDIQKKDDKIKEESARERAGVA